MKKYYLLLSNLVLAAAASAQIQIAQVKETPGVRPDLIKEYNNALYFNGLYDGSFWKSDGTAAGTNVIYGSLGVSGMTVFNNQLYFVGADSSYKRNLWATDGTTAGTHIVKKINPSGSAFTLSSANNSGFDTYFDANLIKVMNGKMYFIADDGIHGPELWTSDGTDTGTTMVKDINTTPHKGINYLYQIDPASFEVANNKLFFEASDSSGNFGLWTSDGTDTGTVLLKAISCDDFFTDGTLLYCSGGYWDSANNFIQGTYVSDGTPAGTQMILPDVQNFYRRNIDYVSFNGKTYFFGEYGNTHIYQFYGTDGTAAGTFLVKDSISEKINSFLWTNANRHTYFPTVFNNKIYFSLDELWATDGTPQGTQMVADLAPYDKNGVPFASSPTFLTVANNQLYMKARDTGSTDLWSSDGTAAGTQRISYTNANLHPGQLAAITASRSAIHQLGTDVYFFGCYDSTATTSLYRLGENTGVKNIYNSLKNAALYPNPATGTISVKGLNVQQFIISDLSGKMMLQTNNNEANISVLTPGIYAVTIVDKNGERYAGKFIKQ